MQNLDELLKQQEQIQDDGFTANVMVKTRRHLSMKKRLSILFSSVLVGLISAMSVFFLSQGEAVDLTNLINGALKYQVESIAFLVTITMVYLGILMTAEEEMG